jgi:hypothetical protein
MKNNYKRKDLGEEQKRHGVECVCPKCGKHHIFVMHWIGRGMPRKFCSSCRDSSAD